jgi:xylulokinase
MVETALGIDVGTSNVKVAIVGADGSTVAAATRPLATERNRGAATQDPAKLWATVQEAVRRTTAAAPAAASAVQAVCCCSQYSSIVPVAANGEPVGPLLTYMDKRGTDHSLAILGCHPDAFAVWLDRHGIPPVGGGLSLAHILHFQHDAPNVHADTASYLEVMDFVNLRLTGEIAATQCSTFAVQLCDNRRLGVTEYDPDLVGMAGVDAAKLPRLVTPDAVIGQIAKPVADDLGIPAGAVVYAGVNDSHAGAVATGATKVGCLGVMIGTTSVILAATPDKRPTDLEHQVLSMPSPFPATYLVWAENGLGGKALMRVLDHCVYPIDDLDAALVATPAGAGGVLFLPWLGGSYAPRADTNMRGGFVNVSLDTDRDALVRAAIEGVCRNLAWLLPAVEQFAGQEYSHAVFGGGAARSPGWAQVLADVIGRPVVTLAAPDYAIARAAARIALRNASALGPSELVDVDVHRTYEPDAAAHRVHALMQAQFEAAFDAVAPICAALNSTASDTNTPIGDTR